MRFTHSVNTKGIKFTLCWSVLIINKVYLSILLSIHLKYTPTHFEQLIKTLFISTEQKKKTPEWKSMLSLISKNLGIFVNPFSLFSFRFFRIHWVILNKHITNWFIFYSTRVVCACLYCVCVYHQNSEQTW